METRIKINIVIGAILLAFVTGIVVYYMQEISDWVLATPHDLAFEVQYFLVELGMASTIVFATLVYGKYVWQFYPEKELDRAIAVLRDQFWGETKKEKVQST